MKLLLIASLFLFSISASAQNWVDLGIKGAFGPTFLMNKGILDDASYNHQISAKGAFGAKIGFNFNQNHEITFDFMVSGLKQDFKYSLVADDSSKTSTNYTSSINYKSFDFLLMYRNNADGKYFEVGPVLSKVRSVGMTNSIFANNTDPSFTLDKVNSLMYGAAIGFGAYFMGTDNFGITGGFRLGYMFSDLISPAGKSANYPTGFAEHASAATHPLFAQIVFEANLDFAYMSKANCGRRKLLMF